MGAIERLQLWYEDEGLIALPKAAWMVVVYQSPAYHLLERVFGSVTHEKMIRAPRLGYWPKIEDPRSFNEKLLHRKLFTDDERFAMVADKWRVRDYVADRVGEDVLTEVYHVTEDPESIPFDTLPDRYVIKANMGCGSNIIVDDDHSMSSEEIIATCTQWLDSPHGIRQREYWYEQIEPKIIVEEFIESDYQSVPRDYKFFVFHGNVEYIETDVNRFTDHKRRFYDSEWNPYEFTLEYPLAPSIDRPANLERMITVAEALSAGFDHIRIDLYNPQPGTIRFGEMTVAHGSGIEKFDPEEWDFTFGEHW